MPEGQYTRSSDLFQLLAAGTISAGQVLQLPSGECGFLDAPDAVNAAVYTDRPRTRGKATIEKAVGVELLAGQEVYFDHSARKLTYAPVNDRDFFAGTMVEDAAAAALTGLVELNRRQAFGLDIAQLGHLTAITGTQGLNTMGVFRRGGAHKLILSTAAEIQKLDALSVDGRVPGAKWIVEGCFRVIAGGAAAEPDFNIGVASGTHATDADAIAEHCFVHVDGLSTALRVQSKDPITTVAATDTTLVYTAGSAVANRVHFLMDLRTPTSVKVYINGARVLSGSTFRLDNAASTLFLLAHLEKTAAATVFEADVDFLRAWTSQQ